MFFKKENPDTDNYTHLSDLRDFTLDFHGYRNEFVSLARTRTSGEIRTVITRADGGK